MLLLQAGEGEDDGDGPTVAKRARPRPKAKVPRKRKTEGKDPAATEPGPAEHGSEERRPSSSPISYYQAGMVSLGILTFLCIFFLIELILSLYDIPLLLGTVPGDLVPVFGGNSAPIIGLVFLLTVLGAMFHIRDSKRNLKLSLVPTFALMAFIGVLLMLDGSDEVPLSIIFVSALVTALLDFHNILNYPEVLDRVGREKLLDHMANQERDDKIRTWMLEEEEKVKQKEVELGAIKEELAEKTELLMEEEETLRTMEGEIKDLRTEVTTQKETLMEEEENLRVKEQEMAAMSIQMKTKEETLMEEEETIKAMEAEVAAAKQEIERKQADIMEEEERIKVREEDAAKLNVDYDIQSKLLHEMTQKTQMMEEEVLRMTAELEIQVRKKIEEEERTRLKKVAGMMDSAGAKVTRQVYPFTAIVGQDKMKLALILNAINPGIGGVLIQGQKGTGKSIAIRGLADILPNIEVIEGCRYSCDPKSPQEFCTDCKLRKDKGLLKTGDVPLRVVDLPLNTTEDRLVGSIDIEKVLSEGVRAFEPGLLAEAHRGILNVDEINLLDDYIVDILLDSAASGVVTVEREGVSISYPARFVIVGSMNPEEGELRPQLLDRLALSVWVGTLQSISERVEIVRRLEEFATSPKAFRERFIPEQDALREKIENARELVSNVTVPRDMLTTIANLCLTFDVEGHRADIIIQRSAAAYAAFQGRTTMTKDDVAVAAELALPHRMKKNPFGKKVTLETAIQRLLEGEVAK